MKKSIFLLAIVALIAGGLFTGNTLLNDSNDLLLSELGKTAYAFGEQSGCPKVMTKNEVTKSTTSTYMNNYGEWCEITNTEKKTTCEGEGMTECCPGTVTSYYEEC